MRKILFMIGMCNCINLVAIAQDQTQQTLQHGLQDSHHNLIASVEAGPTFYDKNNKVVFQIKNDGSVTDGNNQTIGYFIATTGVEIQDKDHKTLGFFNPDRTVTDSKHNIVAYAKDYDNYAFEDSKHTVVAYLVNTEPMWATAYYFLVHF